jgi:hypothetical protein
MDEKSLTKTLPIQSHKKSEHYSLFNMCFDPSIIQNSPPNSWNKRLNKRIGNNGRPIYTSDEGTQCHSKRVH